MNQDTRLWKDIIPISKNELINLERRERSEGRVFPNKYTSKEEYLAWTLEHTYETADQLDQEEKERKDAERKLYYQDLHHYRKFKMNHARNCKDDKTSFQSFRNQLRADEISRKLGVCVLFGTSSTGKSTILNLLAKFGYIIVPEEEKIPSKL